MIVPATVIPPGPVTVNVVDVIVEESIGSLKDAPILVLIATPVAALALIVEHTVGEVVSLVNIYPAKNTTVITTMPITANKIFFATLSFMYL